MAVVYGLFTGQLCWYVGSTTNAKRREREHRRKDDKGVGASLIQDEYEWEFKVLEECMAEEKIAREQYWYDTLHPLVNMQRPGQTHAESVKQWKEVNREHNAAKYRQWYEANRERKAAYQRQHRTLKRASRANSEQSQAAPSL